MLDMTVRGLASFFTLRQMNAAKLRTTGVEATVTGAYVVGPGAVDFLRNGGELKHNSIDVYYELCDFSTPS